MLAWCNGVAMGGSGPVMAVSPPAALPGDGHNTGDVFDRSAGTGTTFARMEDAGTVYEQPKLTGTYTLFKSVDELPYGVEGNNVATEYSGVCYANERLYVVSDDQSSIYVFTTDGEIGWVIVGTGFVDLEGICSMGNNQFALLEERLAEITILSLPTETASFSKAGGTTITPTPSLKYANKGPEGITYDAANNQFYVVVEDANDMDAAVDRQIDLRITDAFVSDKLEIFSTYDIAGLANGPDDPGTNIVRNTNCWAFDLDLTGYSNGQDNETRPGHNNGCCLITRRHAITAGHLIADPLESGQNGTDITDKAYFFEADGTVVTREIVAIEHMQPGWAASDTAILCFDEDLPVGIKDYKILPADFASYLSVAQYPSLGPSNGWRPLLSCHNNSRRVSVREWRNYGSAANSTLRANDRVTGLSGQRLAYLLGTTFGDSGSPVFLVVDDELVFVHCHEYSGGSGTLPALNQAAINAAILATDVTANGISGDPADLTGYTLTECELSTPTKAPTLFTVDATTGASVEQTADSVYLRTLLSDFSDCHYDPTSGRLYVLSHESNRLVGFVPGGQVPDTIEIPGTQLEGVALTPDANDIFVIGEPREYRWYKNKQEVVPWQRPR